MLPVWWSNTEKYSELSGAHASGAVFALAVADEIVYAGCEDGRIRRISTDALREPAPAEPSYEIARVEVVCLDGAGGKALPVEAIPAGTSVNYLFFPLDDEHTRIILPTGDPLPPSFSPFFPSGEPTPFTLPPPHSPSLLPSGEPTPFNVNLRPSSWPIDKGTLPRTKFSSLSHTTHI